MKVYGDVPERFPANAAFDLASLPGESIVSSLWRFSWRNGLSTKELLRFCSRGAGYEKEDAVFSYTRGFEPDVFTNASGWGDQSREGLFNQKNRLQHASLWWSRSFRYCPLCLEHLYHSFWHQSLFLSHCPLDGAQLLRNCYCCGRLLPAYGFHRNILSSPYVCQGCRRPFSGVALHLESRLAIQQHHQHLKRTFDIVENWWVQSSEVRQQLVGFLPSHIERGMTPWLRIDESMRHWVAAAVPPPPTMVMDTKVLPPLVILKWRVRLRPDNPRLYGWARRRNRQENLNLARQVYRATLRRLHRAIARDTPFEDAEYRRHQALPLKDLTTFPNRCNLKLLALIMFRRSYETYFSELYQSGTRAQFDTYGVGFPYGNEFAIRIRICWRAQFIAEYAAFYWWLVAMRDGRKYVDEFSREAATLSYAHARFDQVNGDEVVGRVAFPAVDGLRLNLFP